MPVQLDIEEEVAREERDKLAMDRRDRNSLAIAEVVGRNPARRPTLPEPKSSTPKPRD
jgi:hypothetical protein